MLKIECKDGNPGNVVISDLENGIDITKGVSSIDIRMRHNELISMKMEVYLNSLDINILPEQVTVAPLLENGTVLRISLAEFKEILKKRKA